MSNREATTNYVGLFIPELGFKGVPMLASINNVYTRADPLYLFLYTTVTPSVAVSSRIVPPSQV
jgi:hypothetical protein